MIELFLLVQIIVGVIQIATRLIEEIDSGYYSPAGPKGNFRYIEYLFPWYRIIHSLLKRREIKEDDR